MAQSLDELFNKKTASKKQSLNDLFKPIEQPKKKTISTNLPMSIEAQKKQLTTPIPQKTTGFGIVDKNRNALNKTDPTKTDTINLLKVSKSDSNAEKGLKSYINAATSTFPVKESDTKLMGLLKTAGNVAFTPVTALDEGAKRIALYGTDLIQGNKFNPYNRQTTVLGDILPDSAEKKVNELSKTNPVLGTIAKVGTELLSPSTVVGSGVVKNALNPLAKVGKIDDVKVPTSVSRGTEATTDAIQDTSKTTAKKVETPAIKAAAMKAETSSKVETPSVKAKTNKLETPAFIKAKTETPIQAKAMEQESTVAGIEPKLNQVESPVKSSYADIETPNVTSKDLTKSADAKIETPEAETIKMYGEVAKAKKEGKPIPGPVIEEGLKERGFGKNVRTDANMKDEIRDSVTKDPLVYEQLGNKKTLESAQKRFNEGYEVALEKWNNSLSSDSFRADDIPLARMLANEAVNRGDIAGSRKIIADVSEKLTQAGQFSQAARILRNSEDPGAFRAFVDRQLDKLNKQGKQQYGSKWPDIQLTDDEIKIINDWNKSDAAGREKIMEDIYTRIQDKIPVSKQEKFDTWRRIAMLLNPKTHIRNVVGNSIMAVTRKTADSVATVLEKAARVPEGQRTKAVAWSKDKNLVNTVNKEWDANKTDLMKSGRWDLENLKFGLLNRDKRIFDNKTLNFLDSLSKDTLNFEDAVFMKRAYTDALGQYMSSNKLGVVTDAAKEYAQRRAWEATFRQANWLSDNIQSLKSKGGALGTLTDIAIPFSKTPSNIAARAVEYSPAGVFKALYSKAKGKAASDVIEDLAKGMTGTGISVLGFMLASSGWARGEKEKSKNAEAILNQLGEQAYSINTPLGSYTYDWAQPISVPFAMGVAIYESLEASAIKTEGEEGLDGFTRGINAIQSAATTGAETIFNLTMLQNIQDLLGGGYGSVSESLASLPADYISQAFPTVFGQVARTADDTKRSTYDPNPLKQALNSFIAKTPVASKTLQPNLDIFGREQSQSGGLPSGIQQFLNPGTSKAKSKDPVTLEVARLYKATKETDILPKVFPRSFTSGGKKIVLSPKQITDAQRKMGQENYKDLQNTIASSSYKNADEDEKLKIMAKVISDNYKLVKEGLIKK